MNFIINTNIKMVKLKVLYDYMMKKIIFQILYLKMLMETISQTTTLTKMKKMILLIMKKILIKKLDDVHLNKNKFINKVNYSNSEDEELICKKSK